MPRPGMRMTAGSGRAWRASWRVCTSRNTRRNPCGIVRDRLPVSSQCGWIFGLRVPIHVERFDLRAPGKQEKWSGNWFLIQLTVARPRVHKPKNFLVVLHGADETACWLTGHAATEESRQNLTALFRSERLIFRPAKRRFVAAVRCIFLSMKAAAFSIKSSVVK